MSTRNVTFTAGRAAARAGISRKALRVYLERGLVADPERTPAGYRLYTPEGVAVLTFIRQARALGLHLDDIADLRALRATLTRARKGASSSCRTGGTDPAASVCAIVEHAQTA